MLTKRGDLAREVLDSLVVPKTLSELLKHFKTHHKVAISIIKHMMHHGFISIFKTFNPTRKIYRLTKKGEAIREKLL
jgi:predicted transcriptional regulator